MATLTLNENSFTIGLIFFNKILKKILIDSHDINNKVFKIIKTMDESL